MEQRPSERSARRQWRTEVAQRLARDHDGVVHRDDLRRRGVTRWDVRTEVAAGRWHDVGRHTVQIGPGELSSVARHWQAVWESGSGAALDGASALLAAGLQGYRPERIDVVVPRNNRRHRSPGVRLHRPTTPGPRITAGIPRIRPELAALHAAQWARTDREAMLVLCLVVQQRLVRPDRLLATWRSMSRSPRRRLLDVTIGDLCDGAHSLGELDFAALCRRHGLPQATRQVVRTLPGGRVYLDVVWEDIGLVVEIDGGHHLLALHPIDDALRQNDVMLGDHRVLRIIPVLGLRLTPDRFMAQVVRAHAVLAARRVA